MTVSRTTPRITIVGNGMGGALMAIYFARRGYHVQIFDRRPDPRRATGGAGRSVNMTLAARGLRPLADVGLLDDVMRHCLPLRGRRIHAADGATRVQPYGVQPHEVLYSIRRHDLHSLLQERAASFPNVTTNFNKRCIRISKHTATAYFQDEITGQISCVQGDVIIGADGTFSMVRQEIHRGERADYHQEYFVHGYKELTIPPAPDGGFALDPQTLHVWPDPDCLMIAIPNTDRSFTCTCTLPYTGATSFESISTYQESEAFFDERFAELTALAPGIAREFVDNAAGRFITVSTYPWHYRGRVLLLGDACHTFVPFYGQGMNAALEDCLELDRCVERAGGRLDADGWETVFAAFEASRKPHVDVLARLSQDNFVELHVSVRSPRFVARKNVDLRLQQLLPGVHVPLYSLISHTTLPCAESLARYERRDRLLKRCGVSLACDIAAWCLVAAEKIRRGPRLARTHRPDRAPAPPAGPAASRRPRGDETAASHPSVERTRA